MIPLLGTIGSFLQLIPGLTNLGSKWVDAHYNAQVQEIVARTGCDQATAIAFFKMQEAVQTKWWFVAIVPPAFALPFVLYTWRCVVWDNVIMGGTTSTPALGGTLASLFVMIVTFYFAQGTRKS